MSNTTATPTTSSLGEYVDWAATRWVAPLLPANTPRIDHLSVMTLGLSGEVGEVAEVITAWATTGKRLKLTLIKELGDVAYYWARLTHELGFSPFEDASSSSVYLPVAPPLLETLQLVTAASRVSESVKKYIRDGKLDQLDLRDKLNLVYFTWKVLCESSGLTCAEVIATNQDKIEGRVSRGTQRGSGDDR